MDALSSAIVTPSAAERSDREPRQFPPWSTGRLIGWMIGFLVFSVFIGGLSGTAVTLANIWFDLGLANPELVLIARLPAQAVYSGLCFLFILFRLKRAGSSLRQAWGPFRVEPRHLGLALGCGAALMAVAALASQIFTGQIDTPPTETLPIDWHLVLGAEILANAFAAGIAEEVFFRGLLYRSLRRRLGAEKAVVLSALLFTANHTSLLTSPLRLVFILLFGLIAALLFERTRSLSSCIAFHLAANTTLFTIYYLAYFAP